MRKVLADAESLGEDLAHWESSGLQVYTFDGHSLICPTDLVELIGELNPELKEKPQ